MTIQIRVTTDPEQGPQVSFVDTETGAELDLVDVFDASEDVASAAYGQLDALVGVAAPAKGQMRDDLERRRKAGKVKSKGCYGGVKLTRSSSTKWDGARVRAIGLRAVDAGLITKDRIDAAVPLVEEPKPAGTAIKELIADLEGAEGGAGFATDLAGCKQVYISWKPEIVDVDPVAEQDTPADPVDAFFGAEAA